MRKFPDLITEYNKGVKDTEKITYTDYIGLMLSSVTTNYKRNKLYFDCVCQHFAYSVFHYDRHYNLYLGAGAHEGK